MNRNLAAARLAIANQLEYRVNFLIDIFLQPILSSAIEVTLWSAIIAGIDSPTLGGFTREYYLAYALWATFVGRITVNWMYEFMMLNDIDSGSVNALLMRPISFFEYYLSQFMGYKAMACVLSLGIPMVVSWFMGLPVQFERVPTTLVLIFYYLIFVHTISFCVACSAFFLSRAQSFTGIKNVIMWILAGELIPLDLYPEPLKSWLIQSPFASGVYIPVGYLTGRVSNELMLQSFVSITVGIVFFGFLGALVWRRGLRAYTGTGA